MRKNILTYLLIAYAAGMTGYLIATVWPPIQHWPELETRLTVD